MKHPMDLQVNYATAHMLAKRGYFNIYDYKSMQFHGKGLGLNSDFFHHPEIDPHLFQRYISTPFSIFLYLPLIIFPFSTAYKLWIIGNGILLAAALVILLKGKSLPFVALALLATSLFLPIEHDLAFGQTNVLLLFLLVLFMFLKERNMDLAASIVFALLIQIKIVPAIFALFFLKKREIKFLSLSLAFVCLLSIFPLFLLGQEPLIFFVKTLLPKISSGNYHYYNQSLYAFVGRLFYMHDSLWFSEGLDGMLDSRAGYVSKALSLLVLLVVWCLTKKGKEVTRLIESNEISLYVLTMLLISPVAWFHYFTITLIPYFALLADITRDWRKNVVTIFIFVTCFAAMNMVPLYRSRILVDIKFVALMGLWILFAVRLWRERKSPVQRTADGQVSLCPSDPCAIPH